MTFHARNTLVMIKKHCENLQKIKAWPMSNIQFSSNIKNIILSSVDFEIVGAFGPTNKKFS